MSYSETETESLASRSVSLGNKQFFLDVNKNQRGLFVQIVEVSPEGRKNQIAMEWSTAQLFNKNLDNFIDYYDTLYAHDPDNLEEGELMSEVMFMNDRKYHMDLKENSRGRLLKVVERRGRQRFQVFLPADGLKEFKAR